MELPAGAVLGRAVDPDPEYDPALLQPLPRAAARDFDLPPCHGADCWTAWEFGWLDGRGDPRVGVLRIDFPADSPVLVESKSMKRYLGSHVRQRYADADGASRRVAEDLVGATGSPVRVDLIPVGRWSTLLPGTPADFEDLDRIALSEPILDRVDPCLLRASPGKPIRQGYLSHRFRSLCPVTGQPDHADIRIEILAPPLDRYGLMAYLLGYRERRDFHETCVERVYADLTAQLAPNWLRVEARFTRRGGIDINPWRGSTPEPPTPWRSWRQ